MDDEALDTQHLGQESVLLGLGVDTVVGSAEQNSGVGLGSTGDHVLDEVAVAWRIDDGPVVVRGEELLVSDVDGDTTLALFLESVHDVRKTETGLSGFGSEFLVLLNHVLFDVAGVEEETSNGGGLSVVDVTDKHDVAVWLASVFPL